MDADERGRLRDETQSMRTAMEQCHVHGITAPSSFAWRLHVISTDLLDALDAAESRIAAVEALCDEARAEAEGGGMTDVDTIWPSAIIAAIAGDR